MPGMNIQVKRSIITRLLIAVIAYIIIIGLTGQSFPSWFGISSSPAHAVELAKSNETTEAANIRNDDRGIKVTEKNIDNRRRVALVIGNSAYLSSPLINPYNDARAIAATLRRQGFDVDEKTNLGYIQFNEAVENFGRRLKTGGVGLFYYAGHGLQVQGSNYLVPVDAKINSEGEVRYKTVDAGLVIAQMERAKSEVNIIILDACRDNPFSRSSRSTNRGLASIEAPSGTIIAYATAPGRTASDGEGGNNGLYTSELIRVLDTPGLKIEDVFKQVRKNVREKTAGTQVPWESSSLEGDFFFVSAGNTTEVRQQPVVPIHVVSLPPPADIPAAVYIPASTKKSNLARIVNKAKDVDGVHIEEHIIDNQKIFFFSTTGASNLQDPISRKASAQKNALKKIRSTMLKELSQLPYKYSVDVIVELYDNGEVVNLDYENDGKTVKINYRVSLK
jgi:hypothetical protein